MKCKKCNDEGVYYTVINKIKVIQICNCPKGSTKVGIHSTNVDDLKFTFFTKGI